jgi:ubiquinone/menaquinone biosynthesis C-methylase UbiE
MSEKVNKIYKEYSNPYPMVSHWSQYLLLRDLHLSSILLDESNNKILDVGAGTGYQTTELLKASKNVTAIDLNENMIKLIKKNVKPEINENNSVSIYQMDGQNLEFDDSTFDVVTGMNAFYNFPNPIKGFQESYRVLKKGGLFLASGPQKNADIDFLVNLSLAPELKKEGVLEGKSYSKLIDELSQGKYKGPNSNNLKMIHGANKELMNIATFYNSNSLSKILQKEIKFDKILYKTDNPYCKQAYFIAARK